MPRLQPLSARGIKVDMRVAVVGSRDVVDSSKIQHQIATVLRSYPVVPELVSGGARGVDRLAEMAARSLHVPMLIFKADWLAHGKRAGFLRNQQIVDNCDEVHAWWDGKSKGTAHTIALARKAGKPVTVHPIERG